MAGLLGEVIGVKNWVDCNIIVPLLRKDPIILPFRIDYYRPIYKPTFSPEVKP